MRSQKENRMVVCTTTYYFLSNKKKEVRLSNICHDLLKDINSIIIYVSIIFWASSFAQYMKTGLSTVIILSSLFMANLSGLLIENKPP
jgi:hypothetical protein